MITLTKELKQKWIEALKSGKYGQTLGRLHDGGNGYCCLGVLEAIEGRVNPGGHVSMLYKSLSGPFDRSCVTGLTVAAQVNLAAMNDDGDSFGTIADWIGENINPKR